MDKLLEQLIENQDRLVSEMDIRKGLKTAAVAGLIGGAALGLGKLASTPPEQPVKNIDKTSIAVHLDKEASLEKYFPDEYDTIKKAADRNDCKGEDLVILFAIRKAENGSKGNEFGIMHPKAKNTNLDTQAGWCSATIVKNRTRWDGKGDFIEFLGSRYCPVGAENDPTGLNRNWVRNVNHWKRRLEK